MIKIINPGSWNFGEEPVCHIKAASSGLRGDDLRAFVKRAGHYLANEFKKLNFAPGEIPIHMIALGSTEFLGPNRNGDGFKEASCIKFHNTFEKFARFYRDHNNKDPKKSYGVVKRAFYNPDMHRVELIVGLNGTKEAADRNNGLVADKERDKLESGRDLGVSMSCKVAHDTCSWCGNKAKTRKDYCDSSTCEAGGLKSHMGEILKCGHHLHADNPEPVFFDISHVVRPADRTAYVTGVLGKEASTLSSEKIDDIFEYQAAAWIPSSVNEDAAIKIARDLSLTENSFDPRNLAGIVRHPRTPIVLPAHIKLAQALPALARMGIVLPIEDFLAITGTPQTKIAAVASYARSSLPGIYTRLAETDIDESILSKFGWPQIITKAATTWASTYASDYALDDKTILKRLYRGAMCEKQPVSTTGLRKEANTSDALSAIYAAYTLKALEHVNATLLPSRLTRNAVLTQNYFC